MGNDNTIGTEKNAAGREASELSDALEADYEIYYKWQRFKSNGRFHKVVRIPKTGWYETSCGKLIKSVNQEVMHNRPTDNVCPYCL